MVKVTILAALFTLAMLAGCTAFGVSDAFMSRPHVYHPDRDRDGACDRFGEVTDEELFIRSREGKP